MKHYPTLLAASLLLLFTLQHQSVRAQSASRSVLPVYEGDIFESPTGNKTLKGGALAVRSDSNLYMVVYFSGLSKPWSRIDLFNGDPDQGGAEIRNIALSVPGATPTSGGVRSSVTLTPDELAGLEAGDLFIRMMMNTGSPGDIAVGNLLPAIATDREILESVLFQQTEVRPFELGGLLAVRGDQSLHMAMYFANLPAPWTSIDLFSGDPGSEGQLIENLGLNFSVSPENGFGMQAIVLLSSNEMEDLNNGKVYVRVLTQDPDVELRGQILGYPNLAPGQAEVLSPSQGETFIIGGAQGQPPVDANDVLISVNLSEATDPEGNPVVYLWQISRQDTFGSGTTFTIDLGLEARTRDLTVGEIADIFDNTWPLIDPPSFQPVTYFSRAITSDGAAVKFGETMSFTLIRGTVTSTDPGQELPSSLRILGNYPNPFNPSTTVRFELPVAANVDVSIYNILGQLMLTVPAGLQAPGQQVEIDIDASDLTSGLYLYRITASTAGAELSGQGRMVLLK